MNMTKEEQLFLLFESGDFQTAFLGSEDFFVRDPTWGEHDSLWIYRKLLTWVDENLSSKILNQIQQTFTEIVKHDWNVSEIDFGLKSINLIKAFCIVAKNEDKWIIEPPFFVSLINEKIKETTTNERNNINLHRDLKDLEAYLPGWRYNEVSKK